MRIGGIAVDVLKQYIARIEKLENDKADIGANIREVYNEAKSDGFDPKVMRQVIRSRKMSQEDRNEQETLFEVYKRALGMEPDSEDNS